MFFSHLTPADYVRGSPRNVGRLLLGRSRPGSSGRAPRLHPKIRLGSSAPLERSRGFSVWSRGSSVGVEPRAPPGGAGFLWGGAAAGLHPEVPGSTPRSPRLHPEEPRSRLLLAGI